MGDQLYLERFIWFDQQARRERFPNASTLAEKFEVSTKTAQRSIDHFRDRLQAPLEYELAHRWYFYTDSTFQLPVTRITQEELLASSPASLSPKPLPALWVMIWVISPSASARCWRPTCRDGPNPKMPFLSAGRPSAPPTR